MNNVKYLQNLHTHSTFCDGKNTCEEMIQQAVSLGFTSIGLSGHAYTEFSSVYCMSLENTEKYVREVNRLKDKYKGIIDVYLGIEYDLFSSGSLAPYDYVIGSVHYFERDGEKYSLDVKEPELLKKKIDEYFGGSAMRFAENYFELVAKLPQELPKLDIVGHFDLILKSCDVEKVFDTDSKEYRGYVYDCLRELSKRVRVFEVNTGAVARGLRTEPYPQRWVLEEINRLGCGVILSSDCHYREKLDFYFDEGLDYIKSCGIKEVLTFNGKGFVPQPV